VSAVIPENEISLNKRLLLTTAVAIFHLSQIFESDSQTNVVRAEGIFILEKKKVHSL